MSRKFCLLVLVSMASPTPFSAEAQQGPSFDCRRASRAEEIAICQSPDLSAADRLIAQAFAKLPSDAPGRRLVRVNDIFREDCGADPVCILGLQLNSLDVLDGDAPPPPVAQLQARLQQMIAQGSGRKWSARLPTVVGQCQTTAIIDISDRFSNDIGAAPDAGSAVTFRNGGANVSYDKVGAVLRSRVGDAVNFCLSSIPKNCPAGDDRGRFYTVQNMRSGESWTLPDSQHMCGGA